MNDAPLAALRIRPERLVICRGVRKDRLRAEDDAAHAQRNARGRRGPMRWQDLPYRVGGAGHRTEGRDQLRVLLEAGMAQRLINGRSLIRRHGLLVGRPISGHLQHRKRVCLLGRHPGKLPGRELAQLAGAQLAKLLRRQRRYLLFRQRLDLMNGQSVKLLPRQCCDVAWRQLCHCRGIACRDEAWVQRRELGGIEMAELGRPHGGDLFRRQGIALLVAELGDLVGRQLAHLLDGQSSELLL